MLSIIFGPKRDEVSGERGKPQNEGLIDLYPSPNIVRVIKSRRMRLMRHLARMGKRRGAFRGLVGKPERKSQLGRHGHRRDDSINMDLQ